MSGPGPSEEWLARAVDGDREALQGLVERYGEVLLGRIRLMLGEEARRRADSGDFVQDAIVELLRDFGGQSFADERSFLRWLTAVARNNVRDTVRRRRETAWESMSADWINAIPLQREAPGDTPSSAAALAEREALLAEGLEALDAEYRLVIELRDLEQLSWEDVGRHLDRSADAARKMHGRAMLKLGRALRLQRENGEPGR